MGSTVVYLKDFDDLKLSTPFDFKTFELGERPVKVEDCVAFLQLLALLLRRGQDHRLVRSVHFEKDGILLSRFIKKPIAINQFVILKILG